MSDLPASSYPALKTELARAPYNGTSAAQAAAILNDPAGSEAGVLSDRKILPSWEVMNAVDTAEWETRFTLLSAAQKAWFDDLVAGGTVDVSNARVRTGLGAMFTAGAAPNTRAALLALRDRPCSRAETLFGAGVRAEAWDVDRARALP